MNRLIHHLLAFAIAATATAQAHAAFPEQPITMIVPFPAGGGADSAGRLLARHLERKLGQPVVVMNRPGAGGEIGFAAIARAKPDGYTIGIVTAPNVVVLPIQRAAQYKLGDLAPIANLVEDVGIFFVRKEHRFQSMKDLLAEAKAKPGGVNLATTGNGGLPHFALLSLQKSTGAKLMAVPYSGTVPIRQAVLAGDVDVGFITIADASSDLQGGLVRALGQAAEQRSATAAQMPTLREQGVDVVISALRGVAAPARTPAPVLGILSDAIAAVVRSPEFQREAATQKMPVRYMAPGEFQGELERQDRDYRALWRASPWEN
ncbi:tripartite tricarboxylate transporter substrate binding protein [Ramlibacter sp. WS9]|uniref:tripartite tricarboxylate transporter substrate binding protein n=1 Tax=Ramlibacter sp. WS9 TaxID=1882741 RepID=UPI00114160AC|nr:tripartite tricarboxylate transporter substrate binding protein [Ramlibacter sp. WS9]ROZ78110.1 tripartite tricarboxylate transporter substrate binding protein [Ramlibacter sp. WS9]HSV36699.1 tripartite tricarboxylate transporter substrate binding protein [Ramlibacter sp.]